VDDLCATLGQQGVVERGFTEVLSQIGQTR
jgi:hypothetical protein